MNAQIVDCGVLCFENQKVILNNTISYDKEENKK